MIATIVAERCKKVFILVPSDLLRTQTVKNCAGLGILKEIGVIDKRVKLPNVLCLKSAPKTKEELEGLLEAANIIVSTAKLVSRFKDEYMNIISNCCDTFIVDEAHHIEANRWNQIKEYFREKKILQFTATPFRNDGKKIDGDIIYNFPLSKAQEQGYFKKINFKPILEFDDEQGDFAIAWAAVEQLSEDEAKGYNHIILVRCKSVSRAKELYKRLKECVEELAQNKYKISEYTRIIPLLLRLEKIGFSEEYLTQALDSMKANLSQLKIQTRLDDLYNPGDDKEINQRTREILKELNSFVDENFKESVKDTMGGILNGGDGWADKLLKISNRIRVIYAIVVDFCCSWM